MPISAKLEDAVTGQSWVSGFNWRYSRPASGESVELASVPIENIASWPSVVGEDAGPNGYATFSRSRKRAKSDLLKLLDGDHLYNKVTDSVW